MPPKATAGSAVAVKPPAENRILPSKEAALFRQVLQQYEAKQWKKGVKTADAILKTKPDHGETLAMKGLFLACMGNDRKAEGHELVKKGVRLDMGSHIVWHVYGLLHRADKNYEEALKCYMQANKIEQNSLNILGDLATLSVHLRNYPSYLEARQNILRVQPRMRRSWISLAVAQHLAGQFLEADRTLTGYGSMLREVPERDYEHSEVLLYHAQVLEEAGEFEKCLEFLGEHAGEIVDRRAYSVQRAHLLLKLGRLEPAEWAWSLLLEENPDSYEYIGAYVKTRGASLDAKDEAGKSAALEALDTLSEKFPRSLAVRRLALDISADDDFKTRASKYLTSALSKGVPSVFADLKSLYSDSSKRASIGELAEGFRSALESSHTFGASSSTTDSQEAADAVESSAAYLWTLYFLAQHYSALSDQARAIATIDLAIQHTPSLPELLTLKARILKRMGDLRGALIAVAEARELDGQDRFLNSKHAKYLIRADKIEEAETVLGLFTKKDAPSAIEDLIDMQALWVLIEEAASFARQGQHAMALKRYHQIFNIFADIEEDQYDFHQYCLRKCTLRAYINLVRFEDALRTHPRYLEAAQGAVQIYLTLHDDPTSIRPAALTNGAAAAATEAEERKKAAAKAQEEEKKLAEQKKKSIDKGKKAANKKDAEEDEPAGPVVDQDPRGEKLLATASPLDEAVKFVRPLEKVAQDKVTTWILSFEIAIRRAKYLQALRALRIAHSLDSSDPRLHPLIIRLKVLSSSIKENGDRSISKALEDGLTEMMGQNISVEAFNSGLLQRHGSDPQYILAAAEGVLAASREAKSEASDLVFQLLRRESKASLQITLEGLELLRRCGSDRVSDYRAGALSIYPSANAFSEKTEPSSEASDNSSTEGKEPLEE